MQESVKQDRERYLGGSDIPIIMNLSPFKTRFNLLLEKAGYKEDTFEGNVYTEYGNTMEPKIREYINSEVLKPKSNPFLEGKHVREATEDEVIGVRLHTDGERTTTNGDIEVLEIKTTSNIYDSVDEYKIYLVQLLFYMVNLGAPYGRLAVYERPEDLDEEFKPERLHLYAVELKEYEDLVEDLVEEIRKAIDLFLKDLAKVKANPFITEEELLPTEIPDITARILALESQLEQMKETEKKIKADKERLKAAMVAASVKSWTTPNGYKITLIPDGEDSTKKVFNEDKYKTEHPKEYANYLEDKIVKGKTGYIKITAPKAKKEG